MSSLPQKEAAGMEATCLGAFNRQQRESAGQQRAQHSSSGLRLSRQPCCGLHRWMLLALVPKARINPRNTARFLETKTQRNETPRSCCDRLPTLRGLDSYSHLGARYSWQPRGPHYSYQSRNRTGLVQRRYAFCLPMQQEHPAALVLARDVGYMPLSKVSPTIDAKFLEDPHRTPSICHHLF